MMALDTGEVKLALPEGVIGLVVSPDGKYVAALGAADPSYYEDSRRKDSPEEAFASVRSSVHYCGSEFLYPFFFISVPVECGLKCRLQCALIAFGQRKESERLLGAGDRKKHFCCAKHGSLVSLKHQLDDGALIQRLR